MHPNSLFMMHRLLEQHAEVGERGRLADVGSYDVNGTYRPIVEGLGFDSYHGIDIMEGPNVDMVFPENGDWGTDARTQWDVVISGQCLEHTRRPWVWMRQVAQLVRSGGLVIVIAPWQEVFHEYPIDCWRVLPDGMRAVMEWADLRGIDAGMLENDCFGVARKQGLG